MNNALSAFQTGAGVSAAQMSHFIRVIILGLVFLWAGWSFLGLIHYLRHHELDLHDIVMKSQRILLVVVVMTALVFV